MRCFPTEKQDCRDGNLASRGGGPLVEVGLPCRQQAGTAGNDPGRAKTRAYNLLIESSSQFGQSENQKCWRRLSEEGNRETGSTLSWLAHVFTRPGPIAAAWVVPWLRALLPHCRHWLKLVARSQLRKKRPFHSIRSDPGFDRKTAVRRPRDPGRP